MSLQGQGVKAYNNYMKKSMENKPKVEIPTTGLMNRNKPKTETDSTSDSSDYLITQFQELQRLRAGLKNGRS